MHAVPATHALAWTSHGVPAAQLLVQTSTSAPRRIGSVRLRYDPPTLPVRAAVEWREVGPYWMDAGNLHRYDGHHLLDLHASWQPTSRLELFGRLNNVTNERYAEHASFNEFRGAELAPGMPRTLHVGVRVR